MIHDTKPPLDEALLVHFGTKGMKWGVRHKRPDEAERRKYFTEHPNTTHGVKNATDTTINTTKSKRTPEEKKALAKKVAIGTGILLVAAGTAYVGYKYHAKVPVKSIKATDASKKFVEKITEQTDLIHATRGKNKGFHFIQSGGLHDPLRDYEAAFGADSGHGKFFKQLSDGKVAAGFLDPEGRTDHAGRHIPHQVVIPKSMASGIHSIEDVVTKIWPLLKPDYDAMYTESLKRP